MDETEKFLREHGLTKLENAYGEKSDKIAIRVTDNNNNSTVSTYDLSNPKERLNCSCILQAMDSPHWKNQFDFSWDQDVEDLIAELEKAEKPDRHEIAIWEKTLMWLKMPEQEYEGTLTEEITGIEITLIRNNSTARLTRQHTGAK